MEASRSDDVIGRGVRLATVANVLSMLFSQAPEAGLLENITDAELLHLWPLRDDVSRQGVQMLLNSDEHSGIISRDFRHLFGFNGCLPVTCDDVQSTCQDSCSSKISSSSRVIGKPRYPNLPEDHLANILASCAMLLGKVTAANRSNLDSRKLEIAERLLDLVDSCVLPLGGFVADGLAENAQSQTYRAVGFLLRGFMTEVKGLTQALIDDE